MCNLKFRSEIRAQLSCAPFSRPVHNPAGPRAGVMAVIDDHSTVDQNVIDAFRILLGIIVCGHVGDTIRIEYDDVGPIAFAQQTSIFQTENLRRHEKSFCESRRQSENFLIAGIFAEHSRVGAEAARVRFAGII